MNNAMNNANSPVRANALAVTSQLVNVIAQY
jgi:hypothetical protein